MHTQFDTKIDWFIQFEAHFSAIREYLALIYLMTIEGAPSFVAILGIAFVCGHAVLLSSGCCFVPCRSM